MAICEEETLSCGVRICGLTEPRRIEAEETIWTSVIQHFWLAVFVNGLRCIFRVVFPVAEPFLKCLSANLHPLTFIEICRIAVRGFHECPVLLRIVYNVALLGIVLIGGEFRALCEIGERHIDEVLD